MFETLNTFELYQKFITADPFPHIVIDNFLDEALLEVVEREIRDYPESVWYSKNTINNEPDSIVQSKKIALNDINKLGPQSASIINLFSSSKMLKFLEEVTGITDISNDPEMLGGGIHRTATGGRLAVHADFNLHPGTGKHRRINALLYLNRDWKPSYNGELELWSKDMTNCVQKVAPIFNRLIIFKITDDAYHGHPEVWNAPQDYYRLSFAFYYYTDNRPEDEKSPFHWADWKLRENSYF